MNANEKNKVTVGVKVRFSAEIIDTDLIENAYDYHGKVATVIEVAHPYTTIQFKDGTRFSAIHQNALLPII